MAANHHYPENIQRLFRLQKCLSRKSSLSWKNSKTFSPVKLSSTQIINILNLFKDVFACKTVLDPNHHYPESIHRLFRLQICLNRKSSLSWKYSKTFSPPKLSSTQIIIILKTFTDFFACKIVLAANHHYPENIQRLFRLEKCLSRKSSLSWKNSKTFSPAKLSSTQIINILNLFKDVFACKTVLDPNHHYPESIHRLFRLQICLNRKSSLSWKYSKTFSPPNLSSTQIIIILKTFTDFFACKIVLAANYHYPENFQRLFRQQKCLICKSSLSWKYSKTFSPAKLSSTQIIIVLKLFKDLFACKIVWAENHLYPGKIQRLFCLQNCLSRKSSLSWKYSKTFSQAKLS